MNSQRRYLRLFILLTLVATPGLLNCGAHPFDEEPTLQDDQSEAGDDKPAVPRAHTGDPGPATLVVRPLPMLQPKLRVDPRTNPRSPLFSFEIQNIGGEDARVGEAIFNIPDLCEIAETVYLALNDDIVSDGSCRSMHSFALDGLWIPGQTFRFTFGAIARRDVDGLIKADRAISRDKTYVVKLYRLTRPDLGEVQGLPLESMYLVADNQEDCSGTEACYEGWEGTPQFQIELCNPEARTFYLANSRMWFIPFLGRADYFEDEARDWITARFRFMNGPEVFSLGAYSRASEYGALTTQMDEDRLAVNIPVRAAMISHSFNFIFQAPTYRGLLALQLDAGDLVCEEQISPVGCYPQQTPTFVMLPQEEYFALAGN